MPWQAVPGFAIIIGAFSATGGLCHGIQKLVMRKVGQIQSSTDTFMCFGISRPLLVGIT